MNQEQLKTTWKQRIIFGVIAFLLLFSTVAVYALIVLSGEKKEMTDKEISAELTKIDEEISVKSNELDEEAKKMSDKYYNTFKGYRSKVRSYNAQSVYNAGLKTIDLKKGNGAEITVESIYYAYYIGWCADESVFDSSFDDWSKPTQLNAPIGYEAGKTSFIAGWEEGVLGMKVGGVREIDIPGELAYGSSREICGGYDSPLKFIIMVVEPTEAYKTKMEEYNNLVAQYNTLYYKLHPEEL